MKACQACSFTKKGTLAQVFSCQFCEISKNTFFTEQLRTSASLDQVLWCSFKKVCGLKNPYKTSFSTERLVNSEWINKAVLINKRLQIFGLKHAELKYLKITHIWRRWGTPQNFFLTFIDELERQIIIKKTIEVGQ